MASYYNVFLPTFLSTLLMLGFSQIHETLGIGEREVVIGVIGHCRTSSPATFETVTGQTGFDIQATEVVEDRGAIP
jgi:hypothetical protein